MLSSHNFQVIAIPALYVYSVSTRGVAMFNRVIFFIAYKIALVLEIEYCFQPVEQNIGAPGPLNYNDYLFEIRIHYHYHGDRPQSSS